MIHDETGNYVKFKSEINFVPHLNQVVRIVSTDDDFVTFEFHEESGKHSLIKSLEIERDHFNIGTLAKRLRKDNEQALIACLSTS